MGVDTAEDDEARTPEPVPEKDMPSIDARKRVADLLAQGFQARGYRTAPIKTQLAQDDPRFEIGFELWKDDMAVNNIGVTDRIVMESLFPNRRN